MNIQRSPFKYIGLLFYWSDVVGERCPSVM